MWSRRSRSGLSPQTFGRVEKFLGQKVNHDIMTRKRYLSRLRNTLRRLLLSITWETLLGVWIEVSLTPRAEDVVLHESGHNKYKQLVGTLRYLTTVARPDICHAVRRPSHYLAGPWSAQTHCCLRGQPSTPGQPYPQTFQSIREQGHCCSNR